MRSSRYIVEYIDGVDRCARDRFAKGERGGDPRTVMIYGRCAKIVKSTGAEPVRPWSPATTIDCQSREITAEGLIAGDHAPRTRRKRGKRRREDFEKIIV